MHLEDTSQRTQVFDKQLSFLLQVLVRLYIHTLAVSTHALMSLEFTKKWVSTAAARPR